MKTKNLKLWTNMLVFLLIFGMTNVVSAVLVSNSYVEIAVAPTTGRFTMGTLQGDPGNANDDNKVLLYGHPSPSTSFTTIKVDGTNYKYGSSTMTLVTGPTASTNAITSTWRVNNIDVTQILTLITSSTTGRPDTMEIRYILTNNDVDSHDVGVRVMMDTMLGGNDGAPFKVPGVGDVIKEKEFITPNLPDYWQAFDNLANPNIISQGTLKGGSATVPDRFILCDWDDVDDTIWDYNVTPTKSVTDDSAVAIYWNPTSLSPGQSGTYVTYYGLGKVTVSQGELTLGLTAPSNVTNCSSFTVVAYVSNTGGSTANDVVTTISPPSGLTLSFGETASKNLGNIPASGSNQSSWSVEPTGSDCGDNIISVTVTSSNIESNTANVTVNVPEECCVTTTTTTTTTTTSTTLSTSGVTVTRDLISPVAGGANFTVTLVMNVDESNPPTSIGLTEYYPSGWTVSDILLSGIDQGDRIEWVCSSLTSCHVEDQNITYTVHVPEAASGVYLFNGTTYTAEYGIIGGDTELTVIEWAVVVNVSRSLPDSVYSGTNFTVSLVMSVDESNLPSSLGLTENYPPNWTVSGISPSGVDLGGIIEWVFWAMGNPIQDQNITYLISIPEGVNGTYEFSGNSYYWGVYSDTTGDTELSVLAGCELVGDYPPCGEVTLSEVIDLITLWSQGEADLSEVIQLITAWAGG